MNRYLLIPGASIDTDHSPFLSRPDELVAQLCSL
jgi:hypothetical protein